MKISTKGRYALVVMLDLAEAYNKGEFLSLKDISMKENISLKYLEKIMMLLNKTKAQGLGPGLWIAVGRLSYPFCSHLSASS